MLEPGQILDDKYEILGPLGEGGFAFVYRAMQRHIDREVALKVLQMPPVMPDREGFEARFRQEAKLAARIDHSGVVTIFDFGFIGEARQPYIVMELLDGHDLQDELRSGPVAPQRALPLFVDALDALAAGHEVGVVHKDLKPANLFVCRPYSTRETLKILDFGVARVTGEGTITESGQVLGTPQYLAPEYIVHQRVTPALDVYQMGLILVEVLTGTVVVEGTPLQCAFAHSAGNLSVPKDILTGPLGPVIHRCLQIDPNDRFPDAAAFRDALAKVRADAVDVSPTADTVPVNSDSGHQPSLFTGPDTGPVPHHDSGPWLSGTSVLMQRASEGRHVPVLVGPAGVDHRARTQALLEERPVPPRVDSPAAAGQEERLPRVQPNKRAVLPLLMLLGLLGFGVMSVVAVLIVQLAQRETAPGPTTSSAAVSKPVASDEGIEPDGPDEVAPASPAEGNRSPVEDPAVTVELASEPNGAQVFDGDEDLGQTPLSWAARRVEPKTLRFELDGYQPRAATVDPADASTWLVVLERERPSTTAAPSLVKKRPRPVPKPKPASDTTSVPPVPAKKATPTKPEPAKPAPPLIVLPE